MKTLKLKFATLLAIVTTGSAFAAAPDYTSLTSAVDFSSTTTAILSVAGALAVVYVVFKGAKLIMNAIKAG